MVLLLGAAAARATGMIETPAVNETTSGIGTISGWHCSARAVTLSVDGTTPVAAATGTERRDTANICGLDNFNTGFSLLLNYNLMLTGAHTVVAFADGVEFGRASFTTTTFGVPFLTGKSGQRILRNFPDMNQSAIVQWQESRQNFDIIGRGNGTTVNPSPIAGTYYGAVGTQCATDTNPAATMTQERYAKFDVATSTDNQLLSVRVTYSDSFQCTISGAMTNAGDGYFVAAAPTGDCQLGNTNLRIEVDGIRLKGVLGTVAGIGCFTTRAFYGAKPYRLE
jgi:hypothetical protein